MITARIAHHLAAMRETVDATPAATGTDLFPPRCYCCGRTWGLHPLREHKRRWMCDDCTAGVIEEANHE